MPHPFRPVIGLTGDMATTPGGRPFVKVNESYCHAVVLAGGFPVVLYPDTGDTALATVRQRIDGLLFTGGGDLAAATFGEPSHAAAAPASPQRQSWDLLLMRAALTWEMPILAICLGIQELNVAHGGSLLQHVPDRGSPIEHRAPETGDRLHAENELALYAAIQAPTLMVDASDDSLAGWWGDRFTRAEFHQRLNAVPDVRREVIQDAGHMLHHDQPQALAALVEDFLTQD